MTQAQLDLVRSAFRAYETGDRELIESVMGPGLEFSSPPDPALDRVGYFERCWPGAGHLERFDFVRLAEAGDDVLVTYEATRADGSRFRNTEIFGFGGGRINRVEVYFGWEL